MHAVLKKKERKEIKIKKNKSARRIKAVVARVTRARNKPLALETSPLIVRTESCAEYDRLLERLVKKIEGGGWRGLGQLRPVRENLSILGTYRRETL